MRRRRLILSFVFSAGCAAVLVYCNAVPPTPITHHASWPARPDADATTIVTSTTFAIDSLDFGDDEGAVVHGFDLDGKVTGANSNDVCARLMGASANVQVDVSNSNGFGIDNSFAAFVVPMLDNLARAKVSFSAHVTRLLQEGRFTLQFETTGLDLSPNQTNVGLALQSFPASAFDRDANAAPTWSAQEDWPVRSDGLLDGLPSRARDIFPEAYITNGTFVSEVGALTLSAAFLSEPFDLRLAHAIVVMTNNGDRVSGTIAGVVESEAFVATARPIGGKLLRSLCGGSAFEGIANQFRQASDILADGSNRPGVPCDGISFGVGFTGRRIANPARVAPPPDPPDACAPEPEAGPVIFDAGWDLKCQSTSDCVGAGVDGSSAVCCGQVTITPACKIGSIAASCKNAPSCATALVAACGYTATTRMCGSSADCTESLYPKCCALPAIFAPDAPYFCTSALLAAGSQCK